MRRLLNIVLLSLIGVGCAISVNQDYDTSVNFARLKTYAWQTATPKDAGNPLASNTLVDARVRQAIDAELSKKGHQKVDVDRADYVVTYHYSIQDKIDLDSGGSRVGVGVGSGSRGTFGGIGIGIGTGNQSYEQDTLTIDVVEPKSGKLIWRGYARQRYEPKSTPQELTERFNETVKAILEKFPPK